MSASLARLLIDTLRLGGEDDVPALRARWQSADTRDLAPLVAHEGAGIWLFRRVRALGVLELLPAPFADEIRRQAFEAAAVRLEVESEASSALAILSGAAVPVVIIKGIARCGLASRFPYLDARATQDLDLLVPQERLADADAALRASGYRDATLPESVATPADHHHLPPLIRGRVCVELHSSTSTRLQPAVAWARATDGGEALESFGLSVRVPSPTEMAWAAIAHAMEDDVSGFRVKHFLEVAALVSGDAPIDWLVIRQRSRSQEVFDVGAGVRDPGLVVRRWIAAAMALAKPSARPEAIIPDPSLLGRLLAWRQQILAVRSRLGRRLTERLLAEGVRSLAGLPLEPSPAGTAYPRRVRRRVAGHVSRATFTLWRASSDP